MLRPNHYAIQQSRVGLQHDIRYTLLVPMLKKKRIYKQKIYRGITFHEDIRKPVVPNVIKNYYINFYESLA